MMFDSLIAAFDGDCVPAEIEFRAGKQFEPNSLP